MSKEYSQKTCNLKDIAYTLNDVINEFPEDTKLDTKLIPFENMNMVAILYREAEDSEGGGGGGGKINAVKQAANVSDGKGLIFENVSHNPTFYVVIRDMQLLADEEEKNLVGVIYTGGESVTRISQNTNGSLLVSNYVLTNISYSEDDGTLTFNWTSSNDCKAPLTQGSGYTLYYL